ncbi:MAG TPA: YdbL family protein [Nitrospira sp.]|nr:YdbL family protein [Nitrospira sp.]
MMRWRRLIAWAVMIGCLVVGQPLFALSLDDAKSHGLVGEKADGYLGLVAAGNSEAQALVKEINQKRRQAYEEIARRNGTNVSAVEALAGEKAVQNTKPGNFVEGPGGWVKK